MPAMGRERPLPQMGIMRVILSARSGLVAALAAFLGGGGPSTGGSDLRYSAIAARSSGDNCEVFLITRAIEPPALSPSGISPVSRKYAMSFSLQSPSPFCVIFGTQPSPSGLGPPG